MVKSEHLFDWPAKLFGDRPLHSGQSVDHYWSKLRESLTNLIDEIPEEIV